MLAGPSLPLPGSPWPDGGAVGQKGSCQHGHCSLRGREAGPDMKGRERPGEATHTSSLPSVRCSVARVPLESAGTHHEPARAPLCASQPSLLLWALVTLRPPLVPRLLQIAVPRFSTAQSAFTSRPETAPSLPLLLPSVFPSLVHLNTERGICARYYLGHEGYTSGQIRQSRCLKVLMLSQHRACYKEGKPAGPGAGLLECVCVRHRGQGRFSIRWPGRPCSRGHMEWRPKGAEGAATRPLGLAGRAVVAPGRGDREAQAVLKGGP